MADSPTNEPAKVLTDLAESLAKLGEPDPEHVHAWYHDAENDRTACDCGSWVKARRGRRG